MQQGSGLFLNSSDNKSWPFKIGYYFGDSICFRTMEGGTRDSFPHGSEILATKMERETEGGALVVLKDSQAGCQSSVAAESPYHI
jgi:hypothetical protein